MRTRVRCSGVGVGCLLLAISLVLAACGRAAGAIPADSPTPIVDSPWAGQLCSAMAAHATKFGTGPFTVEAAFDSNAASIAAWQDSMGEEPSSDLSFHKYPPATRVAVCYLHGPWEPPPGIAQAFKDRGVTPDRGVLYVMADGSFVQGPVGSSSGAYSFAIQRPPPVTPSTGASTARIATPHT